MLSGDAVSRGLVEFEVASMRRSPGSRLAGNDQLSGGPFTRVDDLWIAVVPAVFLGPVTDRVPDVERLVTVVLTGRAARVGDGVLDIEVEDAWTDDQTDPPPAAGRCSVGLRVTDAGAA